MPPGSGADHPVICSDFWTFQENLSMQTMQRIFRIDPSISNVTRACDVP